jgi:hypothetical protein
MGASAWSATRARTFLECRRKYYYRYHLAPLGRKPDPPAEAREAERVKDLVGLEAWAGEVVHRTIETVLNRWRAGRLFSEGEAVDHAIRLLSRQFRDSRLFWTAGPEEFPRRPALLDLHYFQDAELTRDRAAALKERVARSVKAFLRSSLADRIRAAGPANWLPVDRNAAARVGELLVLVRPDFAFREGHLLYIVDWKTGKADPFWELVQVSCYALYAEDKWRHPIPDIVPQVAHLYPDFRVSETEYTPRSLREVQLFIRENQEEMAALLDREEPARAERFAFAEDCGRCRWCQFRGLCEGAGRAL